MPAAQQDARRLGVGRMEGGGGRVLRVLKAMLWVSDPLNMFHGSGRTHTGRYVVVDGEH